MKLLVLCLCVAASQAFLFPKIKTVDTLEVNRYLGRWYEMYSSLIQRSTFQKDSFCTTATYSLMKDGKTIRVFNSGRIKSPVGRENAINGTATRPHPDTAPGDIIVNFPGGAPKSSSPNYLVVKLGPSTYGKNGQYQYTIITSPYKALSWILARDVKVFREKYEKEALAYLKNNGYDYFWNRPRKTYQESDCLYPGQTTPTVVA